MKNGWSVALDPVDGAIDRHFQLPARAGTDPAATDAAVLGLPDWFKAMPQKSFNPSLRRQSQTVKTVPAVRRRDDLRFPHPARHRSQGREWRVQLGLDPARRRHHELHPFADRFSRSQPDRRHAVSTTTAMSSSSTISGPSGPRPAIRCCSCIRSAAPICRSRRSPGSWTAILSATACSISRRAGTMPVSTACCRRARRSPNACQSSARSGPPVSRPCGRSGDAAQRNARGIGARDRRLPPAVPRSQALARAVAQKSHRLARPSQSGHGLTAPAG